MLVSWWRVGVGVCRIIAEVPEDAILLSLCYVVVGTLCRRYVVFIMTCGTRSRQEDNKVSSLCRIAVY